MASMTPQLGARGKYQLQSPFDTQVVASASYTCVATRKLIDFTEVSRDPKILYYDANNLDPSIWIRDSQDSSVCIVTLVSDSGQWIYVPSTFIIAYPDLGGIPYSVRILGINLGAIPDTMDLSNLQSSIQNLVRDTVGIQSTAQSVVCSDVKILSQEDHDTIETARQSLITNSQTDRAANLASQQTIIALRAQITALEDYIENHLPATP